jgi:hypothetical protein
MKEDIVSGTHYRQMVHDLTREARSAQKLVQQLITWCFGLAGLTIMFAIMWAFELVAR